MIKKLDLDNTVMSHYLEYFPDKPILKDVLHAALAVLAFKINEIIDVVNKEEK